MPPRITRLKWPRLFPPHEPLPFLYPRWFSVESAAVEVERATISGDALASQQRDVEGQKELGNVQTEDTKSQSDGKSQGESFVRRVPGSVKRAPEIRRLKETKRRELREKTFYAHDWRTPLALIRKHTLEDARHHVKQLARLEMPQGMRGFYPGNISQLFLDVYLHTGCHVQISRSDGHEDDRFSALEISGTVLSIRLAKGILDRAVQLESDKDLNDKGSMGSYTTTATSIPMTKAAPRSVWSSRRTASKELSKVREPKIWSIPNFAGYVEDLVNSTTPPLHQQKRSGTPLSQPHIDLVTERLTSLYADPKIILWASMHATVKTLQYLTQHRKIPEVRRILDLIDIRSKATPTLSLILANPAIFNVLLHSASEALDLHSYNFLLRMMTDRNVAPDVTTWTSLLYLIQKFSPRNVKYVINIMRSRHLLDSPASTIAIANITAQRDAAEWLARGESIFDFIDHYDKLWEGEEWLDTRACNQILTSLIECGNLEDCLHVVRILGNRNRKPNLVTTHILLGAAAQYRDLAFSVRALEAANTDLTSNRDTFDQFALVAWNCRAYNTLRVVWRHACLTGNVSHGFMKKMQKSFAEALPEESRRDIIVDGSGVERVKTGGKKGVSRHQRFKALAGKVAVGIDGMIPITSSKSEPAAFAEESSDLASSATSIESATNTSIQPHSSSAAATSTQTTTSPPHPSKLPLPAILQADLLAHQLYTPQSSFLASFHLAVAKDVAWKQVGYDKNPSLAVLLNNAITVEILAKKT
ncbi:hypothetical protein D6C77_03881 [Aureobasidium pullulans]|uniref:Uncharacterized protein n=1 Tax=Aureobasidium pullulans TaxID=5580 RepID=A0A4T0DH87_AURPU|nr:hypothetical protein D6C85_10644 [Aureobasidium pullulans]TIA60823.1 hypothetical protein D6C77_03881 [Aureobasidium pullulans]